MIVRSARRGEFLMRPLNVTQILVWADVYHTATGKWPTSSGGRIAGTIFETWFQVDTALRKGKRNLPGGSSLAQLLAERRGVRNLLDLPALAEAQILAWAGAHHQRTRACPPSNCRVIPDT